MHGDRERLHALVVEHEERAAREEEERKDDAAKTGNGVNEASSAASPKSDSEQAQANLERMLETGEEDPV